MRIPLHVLAMLGNAPTLPSREGPPTLKLQGDPHQRSRRSGRTRGCPTCPVCRVTLSRGDCLNRMCANFCANFLEAR